MLIEYTITFENGALKISQRVEPSGSTPKTKVTGEIEVIGVAHTPAKGAAAGPVDIKPAGEGGGNGAVPGIGGGNGEVPGLGGGDGGAQVVVFGPIVIDASGLLPKKSTDPSSEGGSPQG